MHLSGVNVSNFAISTDSIILVLSSLAEVQDVVAPLNAVFAEEKFWVERSFVPEDTCVEQIAPFFSTKCKDDIVKKRHVFVDANPKAETRSETKEDSKLNEAQQLISMKLEIEKLRIQLNKAEKTISEIEKLRIQLNKAEETISELKHQPLQPMPSCCFFKCFNCK
ncbi:hypothetical protein Tco_0278618 [Tanacetum coccineum]